MGPFPQHPWTPSLQNLVTSYPLHPQKNIHNSLMKELCFTCIPSFTTPMDSSLQHPTALFFVVPEETSLQLPTYFSSYYPHGPLLHGTHITFISCLMQLPSPYLHTFLYCNWYTYSLLRLWTHLHGCPWDSPCCTPTDLFSTTPIVYVHKLPTCSSSVVGPFHPSPSWPHVTSRLHLQFPKFLEFGNCTTFYFCTFSYKFFQQNWISFQLSIFGNISSNKIVLFNM